MTLSGSIKILNQNLGLDLAELKTQTITHVSLLRGDPDLNPKSLSSLSQEFEWYKKASWACKMKNFPIFLLSP